MSLSAWFLSDKYNKWNVMIIWWNCLCARTVCQSTSFKTSNLTCITHKTEPSRPSRTQLPLVKGNLKQLRHCSKLTTYMLMRQDKLFDMSIDRLRSVPILTPSSPSTASQSSPKLPNSAAFAKGGSVLPCSPRVTHESVWPLRDEAGRHNSSRQLQQVHSVFPLDLKTWQ